MSFFGNREELDSKVQSCSDIVCGDISKLADSRNIILYEISVQRLPWALREGDAVWVFVITLLSVFKELKELSINKLLEV
jgi:hypothetical protein